MRIMIDTNVLISHFIFNSVSITHALEDVALNHTLLVSTFVIDEFRDVVARKWPSRIGAAESFLQEASYEVVVTPLNPEPGMFEIRDEKDYPVLYSAIIGFADILLTGDKDFAKVAVDRPEILTPNEYVDKYVLGLR